jgi:RnfABCDGE-type electron transport complex B subunit
MVSIIIYTVITTLSIGLLAAIILYIASVKFKVYEDPKIDEIEALLPATNCGGCGFPGCRPFAEAITKADNLDSLFCTVGGNDTMKAVAEIAGMNPVEHEKMIAVLRCSGSSLVRAKSTEYDGVRNCSLAAAIYSGETDCQYGCLGMGECVDVCDFDALHMDPESGLPVVNENNCTACNACVEVCPKDLFELRPLGVGKKHLRIYVACMNQEKGGVAKKACDTACIGCNKCVKVCKDDAIVVENFLAYIDVNKCSNCRKCVYECPTDAILDVNFPPRKDVNPNDADRAKLKEEAKKKKADEVNLVASLEHKEDKKEVQVVKEVIVTKKSAE